MRAVIGVALLLLLALSLRLWHLNDRGLWLDEQWTLMISSGNGGDYLSLPKNTLLSPAPRPTALNVEASWHTPWTRPSADVHPPLYAVLVRVWRQIAGESEVSLRMLSVLPSVACVGLTFLIGRRLFSSGAGAWAALIMAVAPQQIYYAQQARSYALATMLSLAAMWLLLLLQARPTWPRRIGLALLVAAALLTHYFTAGVVAAMVVYALCTRATRWQATSSIAAGAALFILAWLPFALAQNTANGNITGWLDDPDQGFRYLLAGVRLLKAPALLLGQRFGESLIADSLIWTAILGISLLLFRRGSHGVLLALLALVLPLCQPLLVDLTRSMKLLTEPRYLLPAMPGMCLLLGAAAMRVNGSWRTRLWRTAIPAAVVILCVIAPREAYRQRYADFRSLATPLYEVQSPERQYPIVLLEGGAKRTLKVWEDTRSRWVCLERSLPLDIGPVILCDRRIGEMTIDYLREQPAFWVVWPADVTVEVALPGVQRLANMPHANNVTSGKIGLYTFERPTPFVSRDGPGAALAAFKSPIDLPEKLPARQ